ncbi:hypothetical protein Tco_1258471 [Tanacetum coccineum]
MEIEQYLTHTDYALWEVIVNGDEPTIVASASGSAEGIIPPKTVEQKIARRNELKAKSTLLLAIPDEHLLKFHVIKDAKSLWEVIKTSQLEIHGEEISQEDANLKLLRSLLSAWNKIALIMRNKANIDTLSMDDLYNNLKVYEAEIKGQSSSSSNSQNVAFVSSDNTNSTNEAVNTANDVNTASSQGQVPSSTYVDDVMFSFFINQSNSHQLANEDLEHTNIDDLEEIDLKWQVAMLTIRVKRFIKRTGRNLNFNGKETIGFDKTKVECYNCHRRGPSTRECWAPRNQGNRNGDNSRRESRVVLMETPANALTVQNRICGYDLSYQAEEGPTNFALMAHSSTLSSLNTKCDILNKANLEIIAYQLGLESLEARTVIHQKNEAVFEEDIAFLKYDVKNELNKSEVFENASNSSVNESEEDHDQVNDRYKIGVGYHAIPPPYTRNFMPPRADLSFGGLNDFVFKAKESDSEDENESKPKEVNKIVKPSFEKIEFVNARNTTVENKNKAKNPRKFNKNSSVLMTQKLENDFEFKNKACFICGSLNHLIKDCKVQVNTAKQSFPGAVVSNSTAGYVNTAATRPTVNGVKSNSNVFYKSHSPVRRTFNQRIAPKNNVLKETVNTAKVNKVTTIGPKAVVSAV